MSTRRMSDASTHFAHLAERDPEQDGYQKHLEQVALGEGIDECGRNDRHQMRHHPVVRGTVDVTSDRGVCGRDGRIGPNSGP